MHTRTPYPRYRLGLILGMLSATAAPAVAQQFGAVQPQASPAPVAPPADPAEAVDQALALVAEVEDMTVPGDDPVRLEKLQRSAQLFDMALRSQTDLKSPIYIRAKFAEARHAILAGRPRDAMPGIEQYVNSDVGRNDWLGHKLLGDLRKQYYPQLAKPAYETAVRLAPNEAKPYAGLAEVYFRLAKYSEAIENASRAVQLDPEKPAYHSLLVQAYLNDKKLAEAAAEAEKAVGKADARVDQNPGNLFLLQELKGYLGLLSECYRQLTIVAPEEPKHVVRFVQVYTQLADLDRLIQYHIALRHLESVRKSPLAKTSADLLLEEARLNHMVHRDERAIAVLEEILSGTPDYEPATLMLGALRAGSPPPTEVSPSGGSTIPEPTATPSPSPAPEAADRPQTEVPQAAGTSDEPAASPPAADTNGTVSPAPEGSQGAGD